MASVNKVILIGRLGKDPETRYTPSGAAITSFSIATEDYYQKKDGTKEKTTEWHNITTFGRVAENCGNYLEKGSLVYIEGKLSTESWEDKKGEKRYMTKVKASVVQFLTPKRQNGYSPSQQQSSWANPGAPVEEPLSIPDDDIPF